MNKSDDISRRTFVQATGVATTTGLVGPAVISPTTAHARDQRVQAVRKFYALLHDKNIVEWAELWHEQGAIVVFYPAEGFPNLIEGKRAIVSGFETLFTNFESFDSDLTGLYPAADADVVCVEYRVRALLVSRAEYTNSNIAVFHFDNGLIRTYHDYFDPRRFQVVADALRKPADASS